MYARSIQTLPPGPVDAADDDVSVRVVGVVVVDGAPVQAHAEVILHAAHEVAREGRQIDVVLRRDDEPELVALARDDIRERRAIDLLARAVEPPLRAVALDAVALDVREVQPRRLHPARARLDDQRLDDASARGRSRSQHIVHAAGAALARRPRWSETSQPHEPAVRANEHRLAEAGRPLERDLTSPTADPRTQGRTLVRGLVHRHERSS